MFCPKCGVRLADTEVKCPLCSLTLPVLPDEAKPSPRYPNLPRPSDPVSIKGLLFAATLLFLTLGGISLAVDLVLFSRITFSGYVLFALAFCYSLFLLPRWFSRPNPVIFFPIVFLVFSGALLYCNLATGGNWYWAFALPVTGGVFLFLEATVTLLYYLRRGRFYIFGALFLALGIFSFVTEILFRAVFSLAIRLTWSLIPLIFFSCLGVGLLVIAIVQPFRRYFEKRFFV